MASTGMTISSSNRQAFLIFHLMWSPTPPQRTVCVIRQELSDYRACQREDNSIKPPQGTVPKCYRRAVWIMYELGAWKLSYRVSTFPERACCTFATGTHVSLQVQLFLEPTESEIQERIQLLCQLFLSFLEGGGRQRVMRVDFVSRPSMLWLNKYK